jgi:hypothetical protein
MVSDSSFNDVQAANANVSAVYGFERLTKGISRSAAHMRQIRPALISGRYVKTDARLGQD